MSCFAIDYFTTLGRNPNQLFELPSEFDDEVSNKFEPWKLINRIKFHTSLLSRYPENVITIN